LFCDAIEITHWLEQDRETSYAVRLHRDRSIGRTLSLTDPVQRVRTWWHQVRPGMMDETPVGRFAQRLDRARRLITLSMAIAGAVVGATVASAVLRYDGASPVNVLTALATLVLLQIGLIVLTLLVMLPQVPGLAALQRLLGGINPGAIVAAMYTRIRRPFDNVADNVSHNLADHRRALFDLQRARGRAAARFARWQLIAWSQFAAVVFNLAVLATAGALITLTDLAFGWSTTLQLSGTDLLRITDTLSAPWRSLWPDAVPDARLIEESRFFRLVSTPPTSVPAAALTGWWPFLMASILTYALLPRLLLLAVSWVRVRRAAIHLLLDDPRVRALLDRMQAEEITLGADDTEPPVATTFPSTGNAAGNAAPADDHCATAVVWGGVLSPESARDWARAHLRWRVEQLVEAGGGRALALDEALIERLAVERPHLVVILVRAWEAPLLDLQDFLVMLRSRLGVACPLIIVPVGPQGSPASDAQRETWSRWTRRIADPALYLETGT